MEPVPAVAALGRSLLTADASSPRGPSNAVPWRGCAMERHESKPCCGGGPCTRVARDVSLSYALFTGYLILSAHACFGRLPDCQEAIGGDARKAPRQRCSAV